MKKERIECCSICEEETPHEKDGTCCKCKSSRDQQEDLEEIQRVQAKYDAEYNGD
jgi:hypothetical protein